MRTRMTIGESLGDLPEHRDEDRDQLRRGQDPDDLAESVESCPPRDEDVEDDCGPCEREDPEPAEPAQDDEQALHQPDQEREAQPSGAQPGLPAAPPASITGEVVTRRDVTRRVRRPRRVRGARAGVPPRGPPCASRRGRKRPARRRSRRPGRRRRRGGARRATAAPAASARSFGGNAARSRRPAHACKALEGARPSAREAGAAAERIEARIDLARRALLELARKREHHPEVLRELERPQAIAAAFGQLRARAQEERDIGAERRGERVQPFGRERLRSDSLASRSAVAASALPPPRPAETGISFVMRTRQAGSLPASAAKPEERAADDRVVREALDRRAARSRRARCDRRGRSAEGPWRPRAGRRPVAARRRARG